MLPGARRSVNRARPVQRPAEKIVRGIEAALIDPDLDGAVTGCHGQRRPEAPAADLRSDAGLQFIEHVKRQLCASLFQKDFAEADARSV